MIDINSLKSRSSVHILETYEGKNPYLKKLKKEYLKSSKITLTENQIKYITQFHNVEPQLINKIVSINAFLGEQMKEQLKLSFTPERILVEFMLADTDKSFHVFGKLTRGQEKSQMYWLPKTMVLDDPYFEEINIEVDFEKYVEMDKKKRMPYEHQKSGVKFLLSRKGCILADDMGLGKASSVFTKVFTPTGFKKMGDIKVGDKVIGSNGKSTNVTAVYPQGVKDLYRITFNDGYSTLCCKEHLWTVSSNNSGENSKNRENRGITLSVEQMLDKDLVLSQKGTGWNEKRPYKFKTYYKQSNGQNKWQIPIVKSIEFENNDPLPIEPYLLGLCLGDGHIKETSVTLGLHKNDFSELLEGSKIYEKKEKKSVRVCEIKFDNSLVELKLNNTRSHTKFIPEIYKFSSIQDRLSILQGLMDTDGHCMVSDKGFFVGTEYCTVSEKLADDVAEIVHSLGGIVRKKSKIGSYKKEDGTKVECRKAYRLNIKLPNDLNPFRLKRKADVYNPPQKYKVGRYISDITLETSGEAVCIRVDADDHLFVVEHGIVTHNTYQSIIAALESGSKKILIVCPSSVKINWEREINDFCEDTAIVSGRKWKSAKFTIINYDILKNFHTLGDGKRKNDDDPIIEFSREMVNEKFDLAIIDEAHNLKNNKSIRGEIMIDLCIANNIERVWLLTGTPIANRPMDYYNLLKLIKAPIADNWKFYAQRYCDAKRITTTNRGGFRKQVWVTTGSSNLEELSLRTKNLMLVRKKTEVLDMPDKSIITNYQELDKSGRSEYEGLWEEYLIKRREDKKKGTVEREMVELGLLRKFMAMEAIPYTIELAKDAIEQGQKVIIFTNFTDELMELADNFGKECVIHNGPMSAKAKQNSIDKFQENDKIKVFIGNIKSAGVGITLTAGSVVIFNSFDWVPGNNEQAEDRCVFGGQLVMTNKGYIKIEDIGIGDMVYTHNGNFKKVVDKHTHLERFKNRIDIDSFGFKGLLSLTHDHKVYVYNNTTLEFEWVECGMLDIRKHNLTLKSNKQPIERLEYLTVENSVGQYYNNQKNNRLEILPEKIKLSDDLLYAFGFFIADGWADDINTKKSAHVSVCQKIDNKKMNDVSKYIINIIKDSFGLDNHSEYIDKHNIKTCTIHSKILAFNFIKWFGKGVKNKRLPIWADELNDQQLGSLLEGYYHGDSYKRNKSQQTITTSSELDQQLVRYNSNLGNSKIGKVGDYIIFPIKSLHISKPRRGEERVYDLSVEDDHSFVVGNYNVHNCFRIGQKSNVSVYYQLFKDTVTTTMWHTLKNKQNVINTIMGSIDFDEDKFLDLFMDEIFKDDDNE